MPVSRTIFAAPKTVCAASFVAISRGSPAESAAFLGGPPPAGWHERNYSEATGREIDQAVKTLVETAYNRTLAILKSRRQILEHGARLLLEKETLVEEDLRALMAEDRPAAAQ